MSIKSQFIFNASNFIYYDKSLYRYFEFHFNIQIFNYFKYKRYNNHNQ